MPETLKLVRDHVPEIIAADGGRPVTRVLGGDEFRRALLDKLVTDSAALASSTDGTAPDDLLARLADLMEVLRALADCQGATWAQVERLATSKRVHEGTFLNRLSLVDG
jgi:predicted house-cleaning noncanonical NTP pyrophosphatase (MazG superfamily)